MLRPTHRYLLPVAIPLMLATAGCDFPAFQGAQIQTPPQGFTLNPDTYLERRMFPDLEAVHHNAWVNASWGNFSGIYINGHAGTLSREWAESAQSTSKTANVGKRIEYGEIEELNVDGRTAWAWTEWWRMENGGLQWVAYRAVIPYDTISYAVEFLTGDPALKIRPDSLRGIVASFGIGKTVWNLPLMAIMAGVLLLLGNMFRGRRAAQVARARNINLVQIPKKKDGEEKPAAGDDDSIADAISQQLHKADPSPPAE